MLSTTFMLLISSALVMLRLGDNASSFPRPLKAEEERECIQRMMEGDTEARNTLIEHNLRLVMHIIKKYYKAHLHQIDAMLPHYLKSIEILIQHYTVPVAIGKSMNDAPAIFKDGLQQLINEINAGNDTINPYMDFANQYPVRDSMRMMRLLYRLSLGEQDKKHEQMLSFSKTVSSLQLKAREQKYKARLNSMESQTMKMLMCTGGIALVLMLIAAFSMMGS